MPAAAADSPREHTRRVSARRRKGSLFRKYVLILVSLISGALLASSLVESYFAYQEIRRTLGRLHRRDAVAAADSIGDFLAGLESQVTWAMQPLWAAGTPTNDERRYVLAGLLRLAPAVTGISYVDASGKEHLRVSRVAMDVVGSLEDRSKEDWFRNARPGAVYRGPVRFRDEYEPSMRIAFAGPGPDRGVTMAEVDLTVIWDVVSRIKIGRSGYAYVVDSAGHLIAHPDISQVLRRPKSPLSRLAQVQAALSGGPAPADDVQGPLVARSLDGRRVLSSFAPIELGGAGNPLKWSILVEQPLEEALEAIYSSLMRTALLLLAGLAIAMLSSLALARRMVTPIRALQAGAAEMASGHLSRRIELKTGDELEVLAEEFNHMADQLQRSHESLESRVQSRTRELDEAVRELKALGHVGRTVSSTLDLQQVLTTIVGQAVELAGADGGALYAFDDSAAEFQLRATENFDPSLTEVLRASPLRLGEGVVGRAAQAQAPVQVADIRQEGAYKGRLREALTEAGFRSLLAVPLLVEGRVLGGLAVACATPGEFRPRVVELLQTFASQSALAIQNARLFEEVREKSRELEVSRLRHFLPRQIVDLILSPGGEKFLESHRRQVTVVFCDLRGFTDFADGAEPEDVIEFLKAYHTELGPLVDEYGGTLERFTGDAIMVFFNDPVGIQNPQEQAVKMAVRMRERVTLLTRGWGARLGHHRLGLGVGIDHGYATLGRIGYEGRFDYAAVGNVTIRAFRLSAAAGDEQILVTQRVYAAVADKVEAEGIGDMELKGFHEPARVYNVVRAK
jgi:adenylate cyclase